LPITPLHSPNVQLLTLSQTSALQKVRLEDDLDWYYERSDDKNKKGHFNGSPVVTAFLPDNEAWEKLPKNLVIYLFSPFGERALTKILKYHVVPNYIVHAEWIYNYDPHKKKLHTEGAEMDFEFPFPTALKGYKLPVHIKKVSSILSPLSPSRFMGSSIAALWPYI
jgi:hypothetical protein